MKFAPVVLYAVALASSVAADAEDECFGLSSVAACQANPLCSWCTSAAVKSACHSTENSVSLPASIFSCSAGASLELDAMGSGSARDCGDASHFMHFDAVTLAPSDIKKGQPVSINATGTVNKPITSGAYVINVKLGGATLYSHKGNVCVSETVNLPLNVGTINLSGVGCPLNPGAAKFGVSVTLPKIAPSGKYQITIESTDQDASHLFCIETNMTL